MKHLNVVGNIKNYIKSNGIKQNYIAQRTGYTDKKISILLNRNNIMLSDYLLICEALDVSASFFLENNSEKFGNIDRS